MYPPNADLLSYHEMPLGKCSCPREPVMRQIPLFKIIHHPLGKLPETEGGFQDRTMRSFGGKRGIGKNSWRRLSGMLPPTATDSIMKRRFFHLCVCVCVCVCMDEWLLCPWGSPRKNTRADCHALLQGIVPTPGRNPGLPHCRQILHQLSHQGRRQNHKAYILNSESRVGEFVNGPGISKCERLEAMGGSIVSLECLVI